jgi:hypothetical protein
VLRPILKILTLAIFLTVNTTASSEEPGNEAAFEITGYCQNLVLIGRDYTKECEHKFHRFQYENGRINYIFYVPNKGLIVFAGQDEGGDDVRFYSRVPIDKIYINYSEIPIDGVCSILGNAEMAFTVSCRSNDTRRKYSALFFSYGKTQKL